MALVFALALSATIGVMLFPLLAWHLYLAATAQASPRPLPRVRVRVLRGGGVCAFGDVKGRFLVFANSKSGVNVLVLERHRACVRAGLLLLFLRYTHHFIV